MSLLGILCGLGPESTIDYYRMLLEGYNHSNDGQYPELLLFSANLTEYIRLEEQGQKQKVIDALSMAIDVLSRAGADLVLIASNTPHQYFEQLEKRSAVRLLSIVEAACTHALTLGLNKVGLFGTGFTMKSDFFQIVFGREGITVVVPNNDEQDYIHRKTMEELEQGRILAETRDGFLEIAARLKDQEGIQGLILGCTEHPLLLDQDALGLRFLNTSRIHVEAALKWLQEQK